MRTLGKKHFLENTYYLETNVNIYAYNIIYKKAKEHLQSVFFWYRIKLPKNGKNILKIG